MVRSRAHPISLSLLPQPKQGRKYYALACSPLTTHQKNKTRSDRLDVLHAVTSVYVFCRAVTTARNDAATMAQMIQQVRYKFSFIIK